MKTFCFKLYKSKRNDKLHNQINAAGLIYNHCIALHKRYHKIFHKTLTNNRRRAKLDLARKYKKSVNQRHDFHFKLAHRLCVEYDTICIEDLNVKAMQRLYGRKIGDLAFSEFVDILKYEASKFGTEIIEVNRYFASSQICHCCGEKNPEVKDLSIREWICPKCGAKHDRDRNAAINILNEGLGHRPMQETP